MLGVAAIKADKYPGFRGMFLRRELTQLEPTIERAKQILLPLGWQYAEVKKIFHHPNGSSNLRFRPLDKDVDAQRHQGHSFSDIFAEELTNWPDPSPLRKMQATLRSAEGVPTQFWATCNPGGPGHTWVKAMAIDPAPAGYELINSPDWGELVYIPSRVEDNQLLLKNDPHYIERLKMSGSKELVRAWLLGDWNIVEGAFFDNWDADTVVQPFAIPDDWARFRSLDWGSAKPFSVGWWAIAGDDTETADGLIERGTMVRYREWYGCKRPNEGLRYTVEQVRAGIIQREVEDRVKPLIGVADPAIFAEDGGPSIAERMLPLIWRPADNKRVARGGAMGGWDQMRERLRTKKIRCFNTCKDSIRTIPVLTHDPSRPEDVDTNAEDHAADEWRYACMSRPLPRKPVEAKQPERDLWGRILTTDSWRVA